jgi:hypothetical protein
LPPVRFAVTRHLLFLPRFTFAPCRRTSEKAPRDTDFTGAPRGTDNLDHDAWEPFYTSAHCRWWGARPDECDVTGLNCRRRDLGEARSSRPTRDRDHA